MSGSRANRAELIEREESAAMLALGLQKNAAPAELVNRMRQAAALVGESVEPVAPLPSVKRRLTTLVGQYEGLKRLAGALPDPGSWVGAGVPGVEIGALFAEERTRRTTMLVRMRPGAHFPAHYHHDDEHCLVIEGDIRWGELIYAAGDFVAMEKSTTHPETWTEKGNLLLISAGRNEFIER